MFCTHCGTQLADGSTFCSNCGELFVAPAQPVAVASAPAAKMSRIAWGCLTALIIFLAICALVALPNYLAERRRRLETPGRIALFGILRAERQYSSQHQAFTCDVAELQRTDHLLAENIAGAKAAGFRIELRDCRPPGPTGRGGYRAFVIPNRSDLRAWCMDETSMMRSTSSRAEDCVFPNGPR